MLWTTTGGEQHIWISPSIPCLSTHACLHFKMALWACEQEPRVSLKSLSSSTVHGHKDLNWLRPDMDSHSWVLSITLLLPFSPEVQLELCYIWSNRTKKSNLPQFPLFQLWFLLWLILISYNLLCSVSSVLFLDKSMLFTVCDDPRGIKIILNPLLRCGFVVYR